MIRCKNYVGVDCINGNCPIALREEYEERCYDVVNSCEQCCLYRGCEDCGIEECSERNKYD